MFSVFATLGDGEFIFVACRDELGQAKQPEKVLYRTA
jgi:hypothetical protein